ncbi:hypothetical protein ACLKA7_014787 [Drosophila subpalustris]
MCQRIGIYVTLLAVCLANLQAAVIRSEEQQEMAMEEEVTTTVEPVESTTVAAQAQSRDKDASVQIDEIESLASVDPAPGTIEGDLSVRQQQQKSAKLLLLSTPAKRPAEVEQQLEEQDESVSAVAGSAEDRGTTTTEPDNTETTTTTTTIDHEVATTTVATTRLFAINATISLEDSSEPSTDNATISIAEQPQAAGNNNAAIELALTEPEAEYVLLDTGLELASVSSSLSTSATHDELQLGSFTHIDSDVHLQPVVHSVEIVPTRFDDPLIVNYVHNLR